LGEQNNGVRFEAAEVTMMSRLLIKLVELALHIIEIPASNSAKISEVSSITEFVSVPLKPSTSPYSYAI